jgi:signal transduction histidine kinase
MIKRLPLRLLLTLPYVVLLLVLSGTVGWLSYRSADVAIDDMATKLHASTGQRIQEATAAYLTNWQYVVAAATAPEPGSGAVTLPPIERALWMASGLSNVRPSYVYFAAPDGRFAGVQRDGKGGPALLKLRDQAGAAPRRLYNIRQPGDRELALDTEKSAYVALDRPWYAAAVGSTGEVWSPVYLDYSTKLPMITLTLAQRSDAGELLGVYGADVPLAQIGTFLRQIEIAREGLAYIVSSTGRIIGSSLPESADTVALAREELPQASKSTDAMLRASYRAIDKLKIGDDHATLIDTELGAMLVSASPLRHQAGLDWRVVVVLPHSVITAGIDRNALRTALLAGLAALAALIIGTLILRSLASEIGALTRAAEQMSRQQTPAPLQTQRRDELGRLSDAFDQMVARLDASTHLLQQKNADMSATVAQLAEQREALAKRQQQLHQLAGELLTTQSEERRAIARELHDEMGQQLAALRINLQVLRSQAQDDASVAPGRAKTLTAPGGTERPLQGQGGSERSERGGLSTARLDDSLAVVDQVIAQVRHRALDLHPSILDDLGLTAALQWLGERQAQRSGVAIDVQESAPVPKLSQRTGLACYRIAQEAIGNALKHAKPTHIDLKLGTADGALQLSIADDGSGFDVTQSTTGRSLGLLSMRERAEQLGGTVRVHSKAQQGTRVDVRIPIEA